jgi:5-methylcytosine-specific restriction endonuclease McrA
MRTPTSRRLRIQLDSGAYRELCRRVLRRDGWHCQACGSRTDLQLHHIQFRSHCGADLEHNLIALCSACHGQLHRTHNQQV